MIQMILAARWEDRMEQDRNDDVRMMLDQGARMLDRVITPGRLKKALDHPGAADTALWQAAVELGWTAAALPEEIGGFALGFASLCEIERMLGARAASIPLVGTTVAAMMSATAHPATATTLAAGEWTAALALAEPHNAGIRLIGDRAVGTTSALAFGATADMAMIGALEKDGQEALILVAIENNMREVVPAIDNSRAVARLRIESAAYDRIGGVAEIEQAREIAAVATAFAQIGGAEACLALGCDYARQRKAFGQPIGAFQAIKHRLADIYAEIEVAHGCAIEARDAIECGVAAPAEAAAARLAAITAYDLAAREVIQVFGGIGISWEAEPHHHYRRARALALELGDRLTWRERLVDMLVGSEVSA